MTSDHRTFLALAELRWQSNQLTQRAQTVLDALRHVCLHRPGLSYVEGAPPVCSTSPQTCIFVNTFGEIERERQHRDTDNYGNSFVADFPAAHSMDTEWYAVDCFGNLGVFSTGEGGAIPEIFEGETIEWREMIDALSLIPGDIEFDFDGLLDPDETVSMEELRKEAADENPLVYNCVLLAGDCEDSVAEMLKLTEEDGLATVLLLPSKTTRAGFAESIDAKDLIALIEKGFVKSAWTWQTLQFNRCGFYYFSCDTYSGEPYAREDLPNVPLQLELLPQKMQKRFTKVRFPLTDFQNVNEIRVRNYFTCFDWNHTDDGLAEI